MRSFCPDEIVASVVRWSHDHVMRGQRFERAFENRTRQVRAVAVECNDAGLMGVSLTIFSLMVGREVHKYRSEPRSKTLALLRNDAYLIGQRFIACKPRQQ